VGDPEEDPYQPALIGGMLIAESLLAVTGFIKGLNGIKDD
jgi:hypothetical protein